MMTDSVQNPGKILQEKREQLGLTLKDVAEQTRIRKVYLESIESGQLQNLPGHAYVTGFIRVYARHLGLDSDEVLARLEISPGTEATQSSDPHVAVSVQEQSDAQPRPGSGWGTFILSFAVVLALGSLFYFMPAFFEPSVPPGQAPRDAVGSGLSSHQGEVPSATKAVAEIEARSGVEEPPADDSFPAVTKGGSTLRMLALAESSLIIYIDDRQSREYSLHDGLELTWDIKHRVRVELAATGVARFWLDDQALNMAGLKAFQLSTDPGE